MSPMFGIVHAQDHVAHDHADGGVVPGGGEGLGVAQDAGAVVVAEGDPSRLDLDALGQEVHGHEVALPDRRVPALGDEIGVRVPGGPSYHIAKGGERVVLGFLSYAHATNSSPTDAAKTALKPRP